MIAYQEFLRIFFRLLNFAILIFLFTHLFFKFFYRDIKIQVRKQLDWWLHLRNNIMQMRIKQREIDTAIANEQWETKRLLDNLASWRTWVSQEQQRRQECLNQQAQAMQAMRTLQEKNYQETLLKRQYVPVLFSRVEHTLLVQYKTDTTKAGLFVDRALKNIKSVS